MTTATVKAVGQAMNTMTLVSKAISIREADKQKKRKNLPQRFIDLCKNSISSCKQMIEQRVDADFCNMADCVYV